MKQFTTHIRLVLNARERQRLSVLIIWDILISVVDITSLALLLYVVHIYTTTEDSPGNNFLPHWLTNRRSLIPVTSLLILFGVKNFIGFKIFYIQSRFISRVASRLSQARLTEYLNGQFEEYTNTDSSIHIRKICFQPFEFCQHVLSGVLQILTQVALILIAIIATILFDAKLFLLLLCILLPPVIVIFCFIKRKLADTKIQIQSSNERSFQYLLDALKGYVESNIYNKTDFFLQRFGRHRGIFSDNLFRSISIQNIPSRAMEIFAVIGLFLLIVIANWSDTNDSSAFITIGAFMAAAYKVIPGIVKVINLSAQMKAYERSLTDLAHNAKVDSSITPASQASSIESISFRNVSFQHNGLPVLDDIDLSIKKGELVGITGKSGRGKTTILNLLLGFLAPSKGQILVNDEATDVKTLKHYWPFISYVRQQPFFIHDSILQNIILGDVEYNPVRLACAVNISGLDEFISNLPEGLGKIITENGKNISGGQQQRIALARALYKNAGLILLDEPFNELDEASEMAILAHFRTMARNGKIVILITHNSKSLACCDKIISLNEQ